MPPCHHFQTYPVFNFQRSDSAKGSSLSAQYRSHGTKMKQSETTKQTNEAQNAMMTTTVSYCMYSHKYVISTNIGMLPQQTVVTMCTPNTDCLCIVLSPLLNVLYPNRLLLHKCSAGSDRPDATTKNM